MKILILYFFLPILSFPACLRSFTLIMPSHSSHSKACVSLLKVSMTFGQCSKSKVLFLVISYIAVKQLLCPFAITSKFNEPLPLHS